MGPPARELEFVLVTEDARLLADARRALAAEGIHHRVDVMQGPPARGLISVAAEQSRDARRVLAAVRGDDDDEEEGPEDEHGETGERAARAVFPWRPTLAVLAVIAVHLAVVLLAASPLVDRWTLMQRLGVRDETTWREPWRLLTSLFVHSGIRHVLFNGLSMLAFAVPLLERLPWRRVAAVYLAGGLGGAVLASATNAGGTVTIGSSGAVAGLFGAWLAWRLGQRTGGTGGRHAMLRTWGVALLVLPSLLAPATPDGQRISVASHVGGLLVGLALGVRLGSAARGVSEGGEPGRDLDVGR